MPDHPAVAETVFTPGRTNMPGGPEVFGDLTYLDQALRVGTQMREGQSEADVEALLRADLSEQCRAIDAGEP